MIRNNFSSGHCFLNRHQFWMVGYLWGGVCCPSGMTNPISCFYIFRTHGIIVYPSDWLPPWGLFLLLHLLLFRGSWQHLHLSLRAGDAWQVQGGGGQVVRVRADGETRRARLWVRGWREDQSRRRHNVLVNFILILFHRVSFIDALPCNPCWANFQSVRLQKDEVSISSNLQYSF